MTGSSSTAAYMIRIFLPAWLLAIGLTAMLSHPWMNLPIYPDEINHRFLVSRADIDHWYRIGFLNPCLGNRSLEIPFLYMPAALVLTSYRLITSLELNRYLGIAFNSLPLALVYMLAITESQGLPERGKHLAAGLAMATGLLLGVFVGIAPTGMVILRSEHLIVLYLCFTVGLLLRTSAPNESIARGTTWFAVAFLLFTLAAYSHPKTIYFSPLLLLLGFACFRRHGIPLGLSVGVSLIAVAQAVTLGGQHLNCPEYPLANAYFHGFNLDPRELFTDPRAYLAQMYEWNIGGGRNWNTFLSKLNFNASSDNDFLPAIAELPYRLNLNIQMVWALNLFAGMLALVVLAYRSIKSIRSGMVASLTGDLGLLLIYIGVFAHLLHNRTQNWYDICFYHLLLLTVGIITCYRLLSSAWRIRIFSLLSPIFLAASAMTFIGASTEYSQAFKTGWDGNPGSVFNEIATARTENMNAIRNQCIGGERGWIAVDDLTYPVLQDLPMVTPLTYIGLALGGDRLATANYLQAEKFKALVTRCSNSALDDIAGRKVGANSLCCVRLR